ncbi:MAG: hypothetical protein IJZ59_04360 [Alphaproteobacteria bacterium]|nr:hypothetical protein [Alphaproteobacteria bacterium]
MLIQCDYQVGDFSITRGEICYKGTKNADTKITPMMVGGSDELYLVPAKYPMQCSWLVIIQSRYPVFYECHKVAFDRGKVAMTLTNGSTMTVTAYGGGYPHEDSGHSRLLINYV